jgi:hypothetical protein
MVPDILKSYQDEIDQLSRRAKASEAAFVGIYKALYDGIDPVPIIENLIASQNQVWRISSYVECDDNQCDAVIIPIVRNRKIEE